MITFTLPLPPGYRAADVLAFHARDTEGVAEQVSAHGFRKGVMQGGVALLFEVTFALPSSATATAGHAHCTVLADGPLTPALAAFAQQALPGMLGLRIDPAPFAAAVHDDPLLGPLVARRPGLRIVQSASVFEALTWAIMGQQINLPFAIALRRTLIVQAGRQHSSGIWCYPEAPDVAALAPDALTSRKFSRAKAATLLQLAQLVAAGTLLLARDGAGGDVATRLLGVKGIGPWTVNYALLRGYGDADCSLHGDVAVRAALQRLLGDATRPDSARTEAWLARYAPYRTMVAAYLWDSLVHGA